MSDSDRDGFVRVLPPLLDRWLRRCHREHVTPDDAAAVQLERALRRPGSLMGEDADDEGRDWKRAALKLAAAWRTRSTTGEADGMD